MSNVGGVIAIPGSTKALLYSYNQTKIALVDLASKTIVATNDLNISNSASFSGATAYISGGLPDPSSNGIWLATADGYTLVDGNDLSVKKIIPLAGNQRIAENIGGSTANGLHMLFSPNYDGVQIVDLDKAEAYTLDDNNFSTYIQPYPSSDELDAGSVDSSYKIGITTLEHTPRVMLIKLDELTYQDNNLTDKTDNTFTVDSNTTILPFNIEGSGNSYYSSLNISGVYIDSSTHLALFTDSQTAHLAVAKLQDPSDQNWTGFTQWKYTTNAGYYTAGDPHAGAVIKSLTNDKLYGYVLDYSGSIIQIDMQAFLDANATDHELNVDLYSTGILKTIQ